MRAITSVMALAIGVTASGVLYAQPYSFANIADSSGEYESFAPPAGGPASPKLGAQPKKSRVWLPDQSTIGQRTLRRLRRFG